MIGKVLPILYLGIIRKIKGVSRVGWIKCRVGRLAHRSFKRRWVPTRMKMEIPCYPCGLNEMITLDDANKWDDNRNNLRVRLGE